MLMAFRNGGRHPPALEVGAGHHRRSEAPESGALGVGTRGEGRTRLRLKERRRPWSRYKEVEYQAPSPWLFGTRLRYRGRASGHGWVTHARIDEDPGIRGHDLRFDKTCRGNRLAKRADVGQQKTIRIKAWPWCDVTPRNTSADLCKDYSLYGGMWNLFCRAGHYPCVQNLL